VFQHIDVTDGRVWLKPSGVACFAGDLPEAEQKLVYATQGVPVADLFTQKIEGTAWKTKPSWCGRRDGRIQSGDGTALADFSHRVVEDIQGVRPGGRHAASFIATGARAVHTTGAEAGRRRSGRTGHTRLFRRTLRGRQHRHCGRGLRQRVRRGDMGFNPQQRCLDPAGKQVGR